MSHTVTVDVKMKNKEALLKAAQALSATIMGEGQHRLFDSTREGFAFKLPNWSYPMVVNSQGEVFYDNYGGRWGNPQDIETLKNIYAIAAVEAECDNLGWYHERNDATNELIVHHPTGGTITVQPGGTLDASGFSGASCAEATLKLEQAMGQRLGESLKPEMNDVQINQQVLAD